MIGSIFILIWTWRWGAKAP